MKKNKSGTYQIKKLYLNPYLDMYNSEILVYEISKHPTIEPILKALDKAIKITNKSKEKRKFYSYEHLKQIIEEFIKYYNEEIIKEKLGYLSPIEYRKKNAA